METYKGEINEFVDWVSGIDENSGRQVTNGLPVSGASIRQLLQKRLKKPIVVYEDEEAGLFRLFASEASRDKWISGNNPQDPAYDPESVASLEIFNFERPSEFVLSQVGLLQQPRYIIKGDSSSQDAIIQFGVTLKDKDGQTKGDSIIVTYTITNVASGITKTFSDEYGESYVNNDYNKITKNIYQYLGDGQNAVNVNIKGRSVSNSIDVPFGVYMMEFSLSSTFDYVHAQSSGSDIEIPFEVNRSAVVEGSTLEVKVSVDGVLAKYSSSGADAIFQTGETSQRIRKSIKIANTYASSDNNNPHVVHTLCIEAQMVSGNNTFYSNVLYYTFCIGSNVQDIVNQIVNISTSMPYNQVDREEMTLRGAQYEPFTMPWSYYTDQIENLQSDTFTFALCTISERNGSTVYSYSPVAVMTGVKGESSRLSFIPEIYNLGRDGNLLAEMRLVAMAGDIHTAETSEALSEIDSWPIIISQSNLTVNETQGYDLKLSAYGKSNASPTKDVWRDEQHNIGVNFSSGVTFDSSAGWDENSLHLSGQEAYATINYCPFPSNFAGTGRVIELDFKTEQVDDERDVLIDVGTVEKGRITVTPTRATLFVGGSEIISTHFKANERMKIAFIFNKAEANDPSDSNLVYVINNGVLERAANIGTALNYVDSTGRIKVGGTSSGIRLYMLRCYPIAIGYHEAYDNYVYDADDKSTILSRNDIIDAGGSIVYDYCRNKIDTVLIQGNLSKILDKDSNKGDSETTVTISYHNILDSSKDFTIINGMIRKHGQSTLNYPISSMKIWTNKSGSNDVNAVIELSALQQAMGLNKNRYVMKDGAIPSNKFVLQANYADSSGANNGAIERLIQKTWYNAVIGGEHKLRTAPQLFASGETVHHNDVRLGETGDNEWVEGYGSDTKGTGKTWADIATKPFPYQIRNSADSFPCAVFYQNTDGVDNTIHFLGQYVFMDDKKSDHLYGERSIYHYHDETDPFCLKTENKDEDKKANRVWNNKDVVRIEVVLLDNVLTSYMSYNVPRHNEDSINQGSNVPCDAIKYDDKGNALNFYWEDYFEMIYPDPDDFEVKVNDVKQKEDKFASGSQFREKADKFLRLLRWITGIGALNTGTKIEGTMVTQAALDEFKATASQYLDVWKLAAYYIFCLRFGLVDSVERNAQLKTYDGLHWHYEPWDMDIAVGNKNDGGFAFEPPVNRDTRLPDDQTKYAFSGRSTSTSNVLWDCLEAWDYWRDTIVPKVAQALYAAGLSYDEVVSMFDEEYSNKWSETMYNESGHYKYVEMRGGDDTWLRWLQGSSISHRHWWLSSNMNYYDAMWTAGDFNNHRIYIAAEKTSHAAGTDIVRIKPTGNTFFKMSQNDGNTSLGVKEAVRGVATEFDVSPYSFSVKDPSHIYGATFIEELDVSCFAQKLSSLTLGGAYDRVLGAPIKVLIAGIPMTKVSDGDGGASYGLGAVWSGFVSGTQLNLSGATIDGNDSVDGLANLRVLDITGQQSFQNTMSLLYNNNRRMLQDLYAIGTGLTDFTTSRSGNKFGTLRLPAKTLKTPVGGGVAVETSKLLSMTLIDSSWENLSFWTTETSSEVVEDTVVGDDGEEYTVINANAAQFTNTGIPTSMTTIIMQGSTASNRCAAELILGWIAAIEQEVVAANPNLTTDEQEELLLTRLHGYTLHAENIRWGTSDVPVQIYYKDLSRLAALNQGNNQNANLKGYVRIADTQPMTSVQLTQLRAWFGNSVFNKSNIQSGLIVDQDSNYVRISVGGDSAVENGEIHLGEGHTATLSATKFLLSEDNTEYTWFLTAYDLQDATISNAPISLVRGQDGIMRLIADEGTIGDYKVVVEVLSVGGVSESVTIYITGVTYPADWAWGVTGESRQFSAVDSVMESLFGNKAYDNLTNRNLRDCYLMYKQNMSEEFWVTPILGTGQEDFTATLKQITYQLSPITTNITDAIGGGLTASELSVGDNRQISCGTDENEDKDWLYYSCNSVHSPIAGLCLHTQSELPLTRKLYELTATIQVGGTTIRKRLNIIVWSDNESVVDASVSDLLYLTLKAKIDPTMTRSLYKSDLLGISGTLDFSNATNISHLVGKRVDGSVQSIFMYLPNVTQLNFNGCTLLESTDASITGNDKRVFRFDEMAGLTNITMVDAVVTTTALEDSLLDFTQNLQLTAVVLTGCTLGVIIAENCVINTLTLGSPTGIRITKPLSLSTLTIESNTNLQELTLIGVNKSELVGFNMFDSIF